MGLLSVTVHRATGVDNKDVFGLSDPYVTVKVRDQKAVTSVMHNNLNPEWNQTFEFNVVDPHSEVVELKIFDKDVVVDDPLGHCVLNMGGLALGSNGALHPDQRDEAQHALVRDAAGEGLQQLLSSASLIGLECIS